MLLSILLTDMSFLEKLLYVLISVIALLPALTFHEWAHGYTAYKLGDNLAKADGRLSLNPLHHLDPLGSLMLLLVGFGWAKPVPVNTRNFKKPRRDFALCSLAGPLANFLLAVISAFLCVAWEFCCIKFGWEGMSFDLVYTVFFYSAVYNIGLGCFNLIPIPPLDGSNIVICLLPNRLAAKYSKIRFYTRYIFLALILIRWLPYPLSMLEDYIFLPLNWAREGLLELLFNAFYSLFDLFM